MGYGRGEGAEWTTHGQKVPASRETWMAFLGPDTQALGELFSRERERLWRVIQFRLAEPLRGRLGPDDVLQEAFMAASQRRSASALAMSPASTAHSMPPEYENAPTG